LISCGSEDAGDRHMSFIVSIVSLKTHTRLRENYNVIKSDYDSHQLVEMMDINVQDPYVEGTVVFLPSSPLLVNCNVGKDQFNPILTRASDAYRRV